MKFEVISIAIMQQTFMQKEGSAKVCSLYLRAVTFVEDF